jgi:hypothetical protein
MQRLTSDTGTPELRSKATMGYGGAGQRHVGALNVETRTYDRAGRLTELNNQKAATVLSKFVRTLDPVGNPTQVVRTGTLAQTQTYTHDANDPGC